MKYGICLIAAVVSAMCHGWGLDSALNAVNKAAETAKNASEAVRSVNARPVVQQPIVQPIVVNQPVVQQPVVQTPVAQQPVVQQPVVQQPLVRQPATQQPVARQSAVQAPVAQQPVIKQPVVQQSLVRQPATQQPVAPQSAVRTPVAQQSVSRQSVVQQSTPDTSHTVGNDVAVLTYKERLEIKNACQKKIRDSYYGKRITDRQYLSFDNELSRFDGARVKMTRKDAEDYRTDLEQRLAKAESDEASANDARAQRNALYRKLDDIYHECKSLIGRIYTSYSDHDKRDAQLQELRAYFNDWESGVGPTKMSPNGQRELISEAKANEFKAKLVDLKTKKDLAEKAAQEAAQTASQITDIRQECRKKIRESKLSGQEQVKRVEVLDKRFFGNNGASQRLSAPVPIVTIEQANAYRNELEKDLAEIAALVTSTNETVLYKAIKDKKLDDQFAIDVSQRLVSITTNQTLLLSFFDGEFKDYVQDSNGKLLVASRLAEFADFLTDTNIVVGLLKMNFKVNRKKLLQRLPEDQAARFVLSTLDHHVISEWNENKMVPFDDAVDVLGTLKDPQLKVKLASGVLTKFVEYEKDCKKSWILRWDDEDKKKVAEIIKRFPKFDQPTLEAFLCAGDAVWPHFTESITPDIAYNLLTNGKAKSAGLELALAKKLPKNRIDIKAYKGLQSDAAKKTLREGMSIWLKYAIAVSGKKAYEAILAKAKVTAKDTFELDGFYLGMTFDDAKAVLSHHFPALEFKEAIDGKGKDADYVIYVTGQKSPFCYAHLDTKKVYLFNFGRKLLKKWYDFDVQTYLEWAAMYGQKTGADMRLKLVEKKTTVYEDDMSRSYTVWFHQEAYQYKNNKKEYLLTYFGEQKDFTFEDGIGGALIKERAAHDFRYVRGDPGSLRARIVRDK